MTSLAAAEKSLDAEGNLHMAKDPAPAETEPSTRTAANEMEPGTSMQAGVAGSETDVMLPSDRQDGATPTGVERAANNDNSLLDSPVWLQYDVNHLQCR